MRCLVLDRPPDRHTHLDRLGLGRRWGRGTDRRKPLGLNVPAHEELEEQEQVRPVHDEGGRVVLGGNVARRVGLVVVEGCQGNGDAHHHLRDLGDGNDHGVQPLGLTADRHQKVVQVHDGMDGIVHHHEEDSWGARGNVRVPAIQQDGDVMVPAEIRAR
jgi:hypothetical protein